MSLGDSENLCKDSDGKLIALVLSRDFYGFVFVFCFKWLLLICLILADTCHVVAAFWPLCLRTLCWFPSFCLIHYKVIVSGSSSSFQTCCPLMISSISLSYFAPNECFLLSITYLDMDVEQALRAQCVQNGIHSLPYTFLTLLSLLIFLSVNCIHTVDSVNGANLVQCTSCITKHGSPPNSLSHYFSGH